MLLDDLLAAPERPDRASMVLRHETRALRDTRMLLARTVSLRDSAQFIEDNAHPRLWRLLAETAMDKLDFATAEKAFVSCQYYPVRERALSPAARVQAVMSARASVRAPARHPQLLLPRAGRAIRQAAAAAARRLVAAR